MPFSIKKEILLFLIIFFIPFYACENIDDTMPTDAIIMTRSNGQYTDEEWEIVKLMPNIENVKWEAPIFSEELPNLILEVKPAPDCWGFISNGYDCFVEVGVSNYFNLDDPLLEYSPIYQRELYSSEIGYTDHTITITIPATELGESDYIAVRSIFTKKGEPYYGATHTEQIQSLWNPYASMTGFDKRFPRPEYSDKVPMHIFLTVNFTPSLTSQCCYFFIGRDTQPIASATYKGDSDVTTKYVSIDCYPNDKAELLYQVGSSIPTVFYETPYKMNLIMLPFTVPIVHKVKNINYYTIESRFI